MHEELAQMPSQRNFFGLVRVLVVLTLTAALTIITAGQALAYGYSYDYFVEEDYPANDVFEYVNSNFDTIFSAVSSASDCGSTLYVGQECDLVGSGKGNVQVEEVGSRHFVFRSMPGHFEGKDKLINFTLYNKGDQLRLRVTASGEDSPAQDLPFVKRVNRVFAQNFWSNFAVRIGNEIRAGNVPLWS